MFPTRNALLISVVFLCGLEETVLSQYGHCTGTQCFAIFPEPKDFRGAQKSCQERNGELFPFNSEHLKEQLFRSHSSAIGGSYWLELRETDGVNGESAAGSQNCSSISLSMGRNYTLLREPCNKSLNGFLCRFTSEKENCDNLHADGSLRVSYTAYAGFSVLDSKTFPPGTIAVAGKVNGKHPDSKHICLSSSWLPAPWSCEVLEGGCEHSCNGRTGSCTCPAGQMLHHNNISCMSNECEGENPCTGEHERCVITPRGFKCQCEDGLQKQDGVCVNITICMKCEHMLCDLVSGVYECKCRKGFVVSSKDPTKCDRQCVERDCTAACRLDPESKTKSTECYCPRGYILDFFNNTDMCTDIDECKNEMPCDHSCENTYGSYRCSCDEGFSLFKEHKCVAVEEETDEEDGSGTSPLYPTPSGAHPGVPSYIKTGSVLGIAVFMLLCTGLLFFVVRTAAKRCGKVELPPLKHPDLNTFYLQQVTTETYKRLPIDK